MIDEQKMFEMIRLIDIEQCVKASWNYKKEDERMSQKLQEALKQRGQKQTCIVRLLDTGFYEVVDGNHRLDAMKAVGFKKVIAFDLGKVSVAEAIRESIGINEMRFETDTLKLAERISELLVEYTPEQLSETMPYTAEAIAGYGRLVQHDWSATENESRPKDGADNGEARTLIFKVPSETFELWRKAVDKFSKILEFNPETHPSFEGRIFEFAITELMNIPDESFQ